LPHAEQEFKKAAIDTKISWNLDTKRVPVKAPIRRSITIVTMWRGFSQRVNGIGGGK